MNSCKCFLLFSRYTSKGSTIYAIMITKPPKPTLQLLGPKTSAATKVKCLAQCCHCFITNVVTILEDIIVVCIECRLMIKGEWPALLIDLEDIFRCRNEIIVFCPSGQVTLLGYPNPLPWAPVQPSAGLTVLLPELPHSPCQAWTLKLESIHWVSNPRHGQPLQGWIIWL